VCSQAYTWRLVRYGARVLRIALLVSQATVCKVLAAAHQNLADELKEHCYTLIERDTKAAIERCAWELVYIYIITGIPRLLLKCAPGSHCIYAYIHIIIRTYMYLCEYMFSNMNNCICIYMYIYIYVFYIYMCT